MLVQAAAASCWVVRSSSAAAVPPSLSARRESERASRRSAVIALADGGSGLSMSLSAMPLILRCTTTDLRPIEPRHQCRKWILSRNDSDTSPQISEREHRLCRKPIHFGHQCRTWIPHRLRTVRSRIDGPPVDLRPRRLLGPHQRVIADVEDRDRSPPGQSVAPPYRDHPRLGVDDFDVHPRGVGRPPQKRGVHLALAQRGGLAAPVVAAWAAPRTAGWVRGEFRVGVVNSPAPLASKPMRNTPRAAPRRVRGPTRRGDRPRAQRVSPRR